jgi:hypothetical protein
MAGMSISEPTAERLICAGCGFSIDPRDVLLLRNLLVYVHNNAFCIDEASK